MARQYGNGSVRKRGRDAWEIQWCVSGKRYRETVRSSTKAGAQDVLRDRLQAARRGYAPSTATIDDLLDLYEVECKDRSARSRLAILRERMGRLRAGAVTRQDVKRFVRYLEDDRECSPATINRYKAIWDRAYKLAVQDGLGLATPFWPRRKESAPKRDYIAPQTFAAIAAHLKRPAYRAVATVAYWTGARKGELLALTWDRVDLDAGAFLIAEAKSGTPRRVRMPEIAKNAVLELAVICERDFPGSPWVFTLDGRQLSPNSLRGAWDRPAKPPALTTVSMRFGTASPRTPARRGSRKAPSWKSPATRPGRCSTATASSPSPRCGGRRRRWTGWREVGEKPETYPKRFRIEVRIQGG